MRSTIQHERRQRRRRVDVAVAEAAARPYPTVASGLRKRSSSRREDNRARAGTIASRRFDHEPVRLAIHADDALVGAHLRAAALRFREQRVEHRRARFVSGKSLPSSSSCSVTPSSSKNAAARDAENARSTLESSRDGPPQKSRSLTTGWSHCSARRR